MDMRTQPLYDRRAALIAESEGIIALAESEERAFTAEEQTALDTAEAAIVTIKADIDRIERHQAQRSAAAPVQRNQPGASEPGPESTKVIVGANRADGKPFATFGHQLAAIYKATLRGDSDARAELMAAASGSNEAVDSEGGYLVQDDFAATIEKRMNDTGTLLRLMSPIEVSGTGLVEKVVSETSRATGSRWGGVRGYWVAEGDAITDSKPTFEKTRTELEKVAALGYATDELLADVAAMSGLYIEAFAEELVFLTEDAIIEGDGLGKPLGIMNAPCLVTQGKETGQAADTFESANISNMWNRFPSRNRANAVWLINQELEPKLDELSIPAGTAALEPRYVTYGPDGVLRIKGRPVVVTEYNSALGDLGDVILADLTEYRLIRKGGVEQAQSMHVKFSTDEMTFRAIYRVGGQPKWRSALTPFKATSGRTVSPFVTLEAR